MQEKSSPADLVTKYDRQVEELVLKRLRRLGNPCPLVPMNGLYSFRSYAFHRTAAPDFRVLAEETANKEELLQRETDWSPCVAALDTVIGPTSHVSQRYMHLFEPSARDKSRRHVSSAGVDRCPYVDC